MNQEKISELKDEVFRLSESSTIAKNILILKHIITYIHPYVHSSTVHNSQNMETA